MRKNKKSSKNNWFFELPSHKQAEYCARLQGKKKSKYCDPAGQPKKQNGKNHLPQEEIRTITEEDGQIAFDFSNEQQLSLDSMSETEAVIEEKIVKEAEKHFQPEAKTLKEEDKEYYGDRDEYEWEKKSDVMNFGEDLKGAARHRRNLMSNWEERDLLTNINIRINRDILEKRNCPNFLEVNDSDLEKSMALRLCLNEFPKQVPHGNKKESPEVLMQRRKLYLEAYNECISEIRECLSDKSVSSEQALTRMRDKMRSLSNKFRETEGGVLLGEALNKKMMRILRGVNGPYSLLRKSQGILVTKNMLNNDKTLNKQGKTFLSNVITGKEKLVNRKASVKNGLSEGDIYKDNKSFVITGDHEVKNPAQAKKILQRIVRGGQFGNALPDEERNTHIMAFVKSMEDLSKVTNLSVNTLTQGGTLGVAFAARGSKKGAAHYESGSKIINLTRKNGFGSLAHELGHAIDNHASRITGGKSFISHGATQDNPLFGQELDSVRSVMSDIKKRIQGSDQYKRMTPKQRQYWTSNEEIFARLFEGHIGHKMKKLGKTNTYLVSVPNSILWPNSEDLEKVGGSLDSFLKKIEGIGLKKEEAA